jgi:hypothetical protein
VAQFDRTIPPGGEGSVTLEVKTKGYQGSFHKTARVFSNDPKKPQVTIGIKGTIWVVIHMKPRSVILRGMCGESIGSVVHLRAEKEEPLIIKLDSVSIPDKVEVELKEIEKGRNFQLEVKNKVEKEETYRGQVKLTTNYPEKSEIVIRISGHVRATVQVRPKVLDFGWLSQQGLLRIKSGGKVMTRPVRVVLVKGNNLKIEKVELENSLYKAVPRETQRGRTVQLIVEPFLEKLKKGQNTDVLKIYTNQKENKVLEVPIRLELL